MVLVVDDEVSLAKMVANMLENDGFDVDTAVTGVEAYDLIKQNTYKVMLLDINMPKISGVELLMLIQADGIRLPIIVMAAFSDFDKHEFMNFDNVVGFVRKPFDKQELVAAVEKYALK